MTKTKLPDKYNAAEAEKRWDAFWDEQKVYKWNPAKSREETFVVDTPPPTVSGSLHIGHVFSYTQTDIVTRYQRMLGKNIFYPMGWDDNGLPTERRVQNYFGIKCDPALPYVADWKPEHNPDAKKEDIKHVSRKNFIEACAILTTEDEKAFERMWRRLGLSVDWEQTYATIDKHCQTISQISFLEMQQQAQLYNSESPTMWDVDFQSAIAQAELEDREKQGFFYDIKFAVEDGGEFVISTTRPELLAACIAVVAHPNDERYKKYFGKHAITPLFGAKVPILPAEHADPEKGTGILMICTFGDINDVNWWKQSDLPIKQIVGRNGCLLDVDFGKAPFESIDLAAAKENYQSLIGLYVKAAGKKTSELLAQKGLLVGEPKATMQQVKFYEKGDRPIEFIPTRQWFIKTLDHRQKLSEQGRKVKWHPEHMQSRYENWVQGLNQDWCISRQRYFGVPFPVWYPVKANGEPDYDNPIIADRSKLPVDPQSDTPNGYSADQRGKPAGFIGDPDVMDTWATSALTPQIASHYGVDADRHAKLFPADIRPQAHEIIRTWAFGTITKAWMHEDKIPWKNILISGWILDPDRKKMSKSKGNVVTPENLFDKYSADAIRYWSGRARLGADTIVDEAVFKIGGKLSTKLFNASRFVLSQFERIGMDPAQANYNDISAELDLSLVDNLRTVVNKSREALSQFDAALALQTTESAFWDYCDNYLELVKVRSYSDEDNAGRRSAMATLSWSLKTFLRLLAPYLPYISEEVWQASFSENQASIHKAAFPDISEVASVKTPANSDSYPAAVEVISKVRGFKTSAQKSLKWEVSELTLSCSDDSKKALDSVLEDLLRAGNIVSNGVKFVNSKPAEGNFGVELKFNESWVSA